MEPDKKPLEESSPSDIEYDNIDIRRELVWEMMIQGVSEVNMAKKLGVHRKTIHQDVIFWRERLGKHVASLKTNKNKIAEEIGNTLKRLEWVFQNAATEYCASEVALSKNRFLNTAMRAEVAKLKILIETGYLPKAGIKVTVDQQDSLDFASVFGKEASAMDDPVKRRRAMEVASKMLRIAPLKTIESE